MSANVESMAYVGEVPWHGFGTKVEDNLTPDEMLIKAGLDWTVSKRPIAFGSGFNKQGDLQDSVQIPDGYALVRDSDESYLSYVGNMYRPVQNKDAFAFFDAFVKEAKLKMHTAGSLCSGKYVWALASSPNSFELGPDKDRVESYVLLSSPHQLNSALVAQQTTVRVVCQNTLNLALNEKGMHAYRMPHSRSFDQSAKQAAAKVLGLMNDSFDQFKDSAELLADTKIKRVDAMDFFADFLGIKDKLAAANDDKLPKIFTSFVDAFDGNSPGADLAGSKNTLWGAVNAVTYVYDHIAVRDREKALRDSFFGYKGALKRKALRMAVQLAA